MLLVLVILGFYKLRIPAAAHGLLPVLLLGVGSGGVLMGIHQTLEAVRWASPEMRTTLAAAGASISLYPLAWAALAASLPLLVSALGVGAGLDEARSCGLTSGVPGALGVLGAVGVPRVPDRWPQVLRCDPNGRDTAVSLHPGWQAADRVRAA